VEPPPAAAAAAVALLCLLRSIRKARPKMIATAQMGPTTAPAIAAPEMPLLLGTVNLVADAAALLTFEEVSLVWVDLVELSPPELTVLPPTVFVIKTLFTTVVAAGVFCNCITVVGVFAVVAGHY
jgi:hypothetical protein